MNTELAKLVTPTAEFLYNTGVMYLSEGNTCDEIIKMMEGQLHLSIFLDIPTATLSNWIIDLKDKNLETKIELKSLGLLK